MNPLLEYVYISDRGSFYNRRAKKPISESGFIEKLRKFSQDYEDINRVAECVNLLKQRGISYKDLDTSIDIESLYSEVKEKLPFYWHTNLEGQEFLYFSTASREVTLILGDDIDGLLKSLKSNKVAYAEVVNMFHSSELLSKSNQKLELQTYLQKILSRLKLDPDKQLEEKPKLLSWEVNDYAFKKFNPELLIEGSTATWNQFLARVDYPEVFKSWVWSIFEPENDGRQLLWLRGGGNDGKSRVISALMQIYGLPYTAALLNGDTDSQFFYSKIYGKRFTVYDDCKNPRLISSEKIHSMLGKGVVSVEHKFGQPFTAEVFTKILVGSNYYPEIDFYRNNERSRLLCLTVKQYGTGLEADSQFTQKLVAEQYAFLHACRESYQQHCTDGVIIRIPDTMYDTMKENCASETSKLLEEFISEKMEFDLTKTYERAKLHSDLVTYIAESGTNWSSKFAMNDLKKVLEDKKVKQARIKSRGKTIYVYEGIGPVQNTAGLKVVE